MKPALVLRDVTKIFPTGSQLHAGLKALVVNPRLMFDRQARSRFVAVDGISFTIMEGETFGIIGRNGAGKSTLLGLMSGILMPTSGIVSVHGRVSPLLELGVGFTPDLTGRENAVLNGVLLGLRKRDVERYMNGIIEFSGLEGFIDQPLRTYSSGMQVRLGFAIAIHAEPDILLVDEVLAVGDAEFQKKCLDRIARLREQGVTIVFVSHDLSTVEAVCDRAAWIDHGHLMSMGAAREVVEHYRREIAGQTLLHGQRLSGLAGRTKARELG
ncbi:MAG: sugar ABC transporter ATP-binding protein [Nitrospiraceae bacterium]